MGSSSKGYNYLIPVDANLRSEEQVEYDCVQADRILGLMEASRHQGQYHCSGCLQEQPL